jgi:chitinase
MQLLRENLDKLYPHEHKLLTSAVKTSPFNDKNQLPIKYLAKQWAEVMDAFYIMNYDITGSFSDKALPMAPLFNSHRGETTWGEKAIEEWESAGIPSERIFLGLPFYGYTQKTTEPITNSTGLGVPLYKKRGQIKGDGYDSKEKEPCPHSIASYSGEYQWRSIVHDGVAFNSSGWETFWDKPSSSPFAFNRKKSQYVTFENPASARLKAKYVVQKRLGGAMLWSLEMVI